LLPKKLNYELIYHGPVFVPLHVTICVIDYVHLSKHEKNGHAIQERAHVTYHQSAHVSLFKPTPPMLQGQ